MLAAVVAFAGISFNAEAGTQPHKGVIRVKLQPEMALQLGQTPRMQTHGGVVTTGITPLDRASRSVKAMSIRPMLPYAPKFARQRAKYGLDRWYVINFDESVSPDEARKIFASTAGVEHSEVITPDVAQGRRQRIPQTRPDRSPGESGSKHAVQRPFPAKAVAL